MEQVKLCGAMFLDLTKAFVTVDHMILLCKLSEIGVCENSLQWFCSYITDRKHRTCCRNKLSKELRVTQRVLTGSSGKCFGSPVTSMICQASLQVLVKYHSMRTIIMLIYCYGSFPKELTNWLNQDLLAVA